jgi:hypothetical protein
MTEVVAMLEGEGRIAERWKAMENVNKPNPMNQWRSQELIFSSLRGDNNAKLSKKFDQNQIFSRDLQAKGGAWPLPAPLGYATTMNPSSLNTSL